MGRIIFTSYLQRFVPCPPTEAAGGTVRDVLDNVFAANPRLRSYVLDEQGRLRRHVALFVNGSAVVDRERLSDPVAPEDDIHVFQALSGG